MSAPYQGETQACTCASPVPTLLEGKIAVVWEGDMVYLDAPCAPVEQITPHSIAALQEAQRVLEDSESLDKVLATSGDHYRD